MIQADIGGGARVDPGHGVQRPGYMIRDFTLRSSQGEDVRISSFRGQTSLVLVFPAQSDAMHAFVDEVFRHCAEFSEQEAVVNIILPYGREQRSISISDSLPILELYDETLHGHHVSGAADRSGRLTPVIFVTDRFGEIVSTYLVSDQAPPPRVEEILRTLEFVNINVLSANHRSGLGSWRTCRI